jgi:hypothetical protein
MAWPTEINAASTPKGGPAHGTARRVAQGTASVVGHLNSFLATSAVIALWIVMGGFFHYSDARALTSHRRRRRN